MSQGVTLLLSMMMYLSPVMYPLPLVQKALLQRHVAGDWSEALYFLYTLNPMTGIIDGTQRALLLGLPPDWHTILPGAVMVAVLLPLSYGFFKRAEAYFADVI
jgi:lipopolysaccharide transport system permease protein